MLVSSTTTTPSPSAINAITKTMAQWCGADYEMRTTRNVQLLPTNAFTE